jgi:hypothetical protein
MKIDVGRIVIAHLRTLRDSCSSEYSPSDLLVFFGVPAAAAFACPLLGWRFNADVLSALLTAYSIFAGLLLNLLLLVYTFSTQATHPTALAKVRTELVKELHDNIAYSILVSIVLVVFCMAAIAFVKMYEPARFTARWVTGSIIFLTLNFVLTLLMILKRIYIILNSEIDRPTISRKTA